jgi:hypothetical protein
MDIFEEYLDKKQKIFDYFGYVEDWKIIPIGEISTDYWTLEEESDGSGEVHFSETIDGLSSSEHYSYEIYTQRHLPKWVYRGEDYTMICVDTHVDGNKLLQIFDNKKECSTLIFNCK